MDILEKILINEFEAFKKKIQEDNNEVNFDIIDSKGNVVLPIKTIDELPNLTTPYEMEYDINMIKDILYNNEVKIIKNIKLEQALKIQKNILQKESNEFLSPFGGMIFRISNSSAINLTHPVILSLLITNYKKYKKGERINIDKDIFEAKGDVFIFETRKPHEKLDKKIFNDILKLEAYILNKVLKSKDILTTNVVNITDTFLSNAIPALNNSYIDIDMQINIKNMYIPLHIYVYGEMVPFYGHAIVEIKNGNAYGYMIDDTWFTGNISTEGSDAGKVCTGSYSNISLRGWRTLSKINGHSMWTSARLPETFKYNFAAAKELCRNIYKLSEI